MFGIKLKYFYLVALITSLSTVIGAQNEMIKPFKGSTNYWGYQDSNSNIVIHPIFDVVTPMISNFIEIEAESIDIKNLLLENHEAFFRNPIGVVVKGDSIGIVDHRGKFLLNPLKCKLRTIYQLDELKIIENLEESSDDYGKIALISQSGLFITSFLMCQLEEYDGGRLEPHLYYYRHQAIEDLFLTDCGESYNIFINQTDGFIKHIPDSVQVTIATNGYYFVEKNQEQKVDLFHNDTYIKSIVIPENYRGLNYYTNGIFSLTNDIQNCILMDTSGRVYYTLENGYLEGINDHGHAKIGKDHKIIYVDHEGNSLFEAPIGLEYFSNKDGYQLYNGDSIVNFDKRFNKTSTVASQNDGDNHQENQINSALFFSLCQDSTYYKELRLKNTSALTHIKTHEFDNGKYSFIEFKFENEKYFHSKCSIEPFFPFDRVYNFEYLGNDIFLIYVDRLVIVYQYSKGELGRFDYQVLRRFTFQGRKYFSTREEDTQNVDIYDQSFIKLDRNYKYFDSSLNEINCSISHKVVNGKFVFEIFGHHGVINFDNLDANFALDNVKFWHKRNLTSSYSIYMGIRDTFSFHIVELNFSNIIEAPQDYKIHQYSLEFDSLHTIQTKQNFLDRKNLAEVTILDSLICVMVTDDKSICLDLNNRTNFRINNEVLYPETHAYYYNRRVKFDCNDVGYIDKKGKQVIPFLYNYNHWTSFKYGVAIVMKFKGEDSFERKYALIDTLGKLLIPFDDCDLKFDHLGKFVIKQCQNVDGFSKYYIYDLGGKFVSEFEYIDNGQDYLYGLIPNIGYRVFYGDINSFLDVSEVVFKDKELWIKKDDKEYILKGSELVLASQPLFTINKKMHYFLTREMSIQVDGDLLTFVQKYSAPISAIYGTISLIDYENGFVYIADKYQDILIYNFKGEKLFNAKKSELEYYSKYKLFILSNYDEIRQRNIYQYHYM